MTLEELRDVISDEGYSGDRRKCWIKQVLTQVAIEHTRLPSKDGGRLVEEIKSVIHQLHDGRRTLLDDIL